MLSSNKHELVIKYLQEQIAQADFRAKAYVFDEQNHKNPTRNCFVKLNMYLNDFLAGNPAIRWLVIPGFRGVGKTTLLSQLYHETTLPNILKLYLSVDQLTQLVGAPLHETLAIYEELIGTAFERLDKPVFLFLDEIQYDPKWAITLKSVFDRSPKVFIVCTGSSALSLQTNPDVARRAIFEKLYPMSFTEYIKIKNGKFETKGLSGQIRKALFNSTNAIEVFDQLKSIETKVRQYWAGIERLEIDRYLKYGTLPFAIKLKNEGLIYDQIKKILDRVTSLDIAQLGQFTSDIISKVPEVLYTVAASDTISIINLAKDLGIDRLTLSQILLLLEKTETLVRIYPYGAHGTQVRKPSKYLFSSPAFRSMYYNFIGNIITQQNYMGKLLEDSLGLYLNRCLASLNPSLTYDSSANGADFIVKIHDQNIIIETGHGPKGHQQIENTSKRVSAKYGLVVSMSPLGMPSNNIVTIPLSYFLLM